MQLFEMILMVSLGLAILAAAVIALITRKTAVAMLAAGAISLFASVFFLVLASPDVAMTEAAIGAGLSTFLFFVILRKTENHAEK